MKREMEEIKLLGRDLFQSQEKMEKAGQVVMPGEIIGKVDPAKTTKIGIGVIQNQENLIATKCGILRSKGNHVWVDNRQKRVRTPLRIL